MATYKCPFCKSNIFSDENTFYQTYARYSDYRSLPYTLDSGYSLLAKFYNCPNCSKISSTIEYDGSELPKKLIPVYPSSNAVQFPEYVPLAIRQDYEEACNIVSLSPKSSATLARRCLQGMIRDYWCIKLKNLNQEISALKDKIDPNLWIVLDGVRQIGNIGAHMESDINTIIDIDSNEAEKLIQLIELLIQEWYITRHERENLFSDILGINLDKQYARKKTE